MWKQNWLLTQARSLAGTYSSHTAGGSTTWLSQSKTGKFLVAVIGGCSCRGVGGGASIAQLEPLDPPVEPVQELVADAELVEVANRVGEVVAAGAAAAAARARRSRAAALERQPPGVVADCRAAP